LTRARDALERDQVALLARDLNRSGATQEGVRELRDLAAELLEDEPFFGTSRYTSYFVEASLEDLARLKEAGQVSEAGSARLGEIQE
jgi:hypothetical protein